MGDRADAFFVPERCLDAKSVSRYSRIDHGDKMIELEKHEFKKVVHLLNGIKQVVLPYAVCEGYNPGRVFVDDVNHPETLMIWTPVGDYFLVLGQVPMPGDLSGLLTGTFIPASKEAMRMTGRRKPPPLLFQCG
jgi:hypothetical protein